MDKDTRNAIERATQRARKLLEDDFASQLEGTFDLLRAGTVAPKAGAHLSPRQVFQRDKIVAAIEHKRAAGISAAEAVADYLRDAAFTTLNRFVALKMLEARELVQECITKSEQSAGYREFCGLAPGVALLPESAGYRFYIESLFDELSTEVKVLFDQRDPASVLWPKRATFECLLDMLNATNLANVWGEDETIGWVYQYFNSGDERRAMREASQAPRNSRELAVRNQFFTPRYVVQFLTDNTLGRIWYEMRAGQTALVDRCEYMVRRPRETYAPRAKKDPRDVQVLDPACGSGHFLLYAFDLLIAIYEEAYSDPGGPSSEATGRALAVDYVSIDELRRAVPALILAHNLHGVDIDPRCAQIAQLALWMRAQRAYREFGIGRAKRPLIRRSNIVVAEPLVTDDATLNDFLKKLGDAELGRVFTDLVDALKLAGDLGLLLRVEGLIARGPKRGQTGELFAPAEARIRATLPSFVAASGAFAATKRRLFADDAAQGVGLLEAAEKKFDVVLMNPPFGEPSDRSRQAHKVLYPDAADNLAVSFISRGAELLAPRGCLGAIADCSWQTKFDYSAFRRRLIAHGLVQCVVNLGWGVLDANVETSVGVFGAEGPEFLGWRCPPNARAEDLKRWITTRPSSSYLLSDFAEMPNAVLAYEMPRAEFAAYEARSFLPTSILRAVAGIKSCDSSADFRTWWEVSPSALALRSSSADWMLLHNGSPYCPFHYPALFAVRAKRGFQDLLARGGALPGAAYYGSPGCTYGKRTERMYAYLRAEQEVFSQEGQALFPVADATVWDVLAVANSAIFARHANYVAGQHKYHNYINQIALARTRHRTAAAAAREAHSVLAQLDASNELAPNFVHPGSCPEFDLDLAPPVRALRARKRIDRVIALHSEVNLAFAMEEADREPPQGIDYYEAYFGRTFCEELVQGVWVSWAMGRAFGRWGELARHSALVDDPGTASDVTTALESELPREQFQYDALRELTRTNLFREHIARYSRSRRKAPVYWQLATPRASYSVWLYLHAFSKDTLYKVQNDFATPKLAHEERKLESLRREMRESPKPAERNTLVAQETFVEELRAFLDELKRVAPLWNPNLDDGVIINFAPLWRLVPHHKAWQKELNATWDALCEGKYDWAHLAMHLWPERVVPKCATDRSLAIAHGVEDAFWVEDENGRWKRRATPTRPIGEIVRERSSAAVKAALKSLLDAPAAPRNGGARGRRRASSAATEGVNC